MNKGNFDVHKFNAQKIVAQWIVDAYDFIYISENGDYWPCNDPEDSDVNPDKYIPLWYEYEPEAVNRLAIFLGEKKYTGFQDGKWVSSMGNDNI